MSCPAILSGIAKDCSPNYGGLAMLYLISKSDFLGATETDNVVTDIDLASNAKFKSYVIGPNTGSMTSTEVIDKAGNISHVSNDLAVQFNKMETAKRVEMNAMALVDMVGIAKDMNGKFWLLGADDRWPLNKSAGDGNTGTQISDANRYALTLNAITAGYPPEVDPDLIPTIVE